MKWIFLAVIIMLISIPLAAGQKYINTEVLEINLQITGGFDASPGKDASLKYITANLSFFPREDYRQEILHFNTIPDSNKDESNIIYRWDEPGFGTYRFIVDSRLRVEDNHKEITRKVTFPVESVPEEAEEFLMPSATADSDNEAVMRLANELAEGEDDLFVVVHNLATWTQQNIEYNLSTLTADVSEKASWVLANRKGVCDEITNLFIAMCRSLGIPARFVSGIAYTESELFSENWGPHGWAEVYFPDYGWVQYDVTYQQFGWIDATHIKLKASIDAEDSSTRYNWLGRDVEIATRPLEMDVKVLSANGIDYGNIDLFVNAEKLETGFGSHNLIRADIRNNNPYYVSLQPRLIKTKETSVVGDEEKSIVLAPKETETVFWIIKIDELSAGYVYTFPISITTNKNLTDKTNFVVESDGPDFSYDEIKDLLLSHAQEEEKIYSKNISIECKPEKEQAYTENAINCFIRNKGNFYFEDLSVCFKDRCRTIDLGISQTEEVRFIIQNETAGKKENSIFVSGKDVSRNAVVSYEILDEPAIKISDVSAPLEAGFEEDFTVSFLASKESYSDPSDVRITLSQGGYKKEWTIDSMDKDHKFSIDMKGSNMGFGMNNFIVSVEYQDGLGNPYRVQEEINIRLKDPSIGESAIVLLNMLGMRMMTPRGLIEFAVISLLVFGTIGFFILRKR